MIKECTRKDWYVRFNRSSINPSATKGSDFAVWFSVILNFENGYRVRSRTKHCRRGNTFSIPKWMFLVHRRTSSTLKHSTQERPINPQLPCHPCVYSPTLQLYDFSSTLEPASFVPKPAWVSHKLKHVPMDHHTISMHCPIPTCQRTSWPQQHLTELCLFDLCIA